MKRGIIDIGMKAWLGFHSYISPAYIFRVKLCRAIVVGEVPLIELGAGYMLDIAEIAASIEAIMAACPALIPSGSHVPYYDGSGEWICPEDIKFDRATAPVLVSPYHWVNFSVIPVNLTLFWTSTLFYIPVGDAYTDVPSLLPNCEPPVQVGVDGAYFMPLKERFASEEYRLSEKFWTLEQTRYKHWGGWYVDGCDLDTPHIVSDYTDTNPYSSDPYSWANQVYGIYNTTCRDEFGGFGIAETSLPTVSYYYTYRYKSDDPELEWYPSRSHLPFGGGGGNPFIPMFIENFMSKSVSLGAKDLYSPFIVNGSSFQVNGSDFLIREH